MNRIQQALLLIIGLAIPAAAAHSTLTLKDDALCFASGTATYRLVSHAPAPDFRVKIDPDATNPDLRMQLVDRPELADFVMVDDFGRVERSVCRSATPIQTVSLANDHQLPDVVVRLSADAHGADYKLYVHSMRLSQQSAAALLAAMWKAEQRRTLAAHTDR